MKFRIWPRTLVVQRIAVTAIAVPLSNIVVTIWFERGMVIDLSSGHPQ